MKRNEENIEDVNMRKQNDTISLKYQDGSNIALKFSRQGCVESNGLLEENMLHTRNKKILSRNYR